MLSLHTFVRGTNLTKPVNFRVGWLQDANTGLFFVYNEPEGIGDFVPSFAGRSVIVKYTHLFDVLD